MTEREAFEARYAGVHFPETFMNGAWDGWESRAALSSPDLLAALVRIMASIDAHEEIHATDGDDIARMVEWAEAFDNARDVLAAITKDKP